MWFVSFRDTSRPKFNPLKYRWETSEHKGNAHKLGKNLMLEIRYKIFGLIWLKLDLLIKIYMCKVFYYKSFGKFKLNLFNIDQFLIGQIGKFLSPLSV